MRLYKCVLCTACSFFVSFFCPTHLPPSFVYCIYLTPIGYDDEMMMYSLSDSTHTRKPARSRQVNWTSSCLQHFHILSQSSC